MSPQNNSRTTKRMSDAAVQAKTGKTWKEWFAILDKAGARKMDHKQIVAHLAKRHKVGPWWQQMVTVGYEVGRGMRDWHQKSDGYSIGASKTIEASVAAAFRAWNDEKSRRRWLTKPLHIRTARPNKSMRITWGDNKTSVIVMFYPKGARKSQVAVSHEKLPDNKAAARMKNYWAETLERLKGTLEA